MTASAGESMKAALQSLDLCSSTIQVNVLTMLCPQSTIDPVCNSLLGLRFGAGFHPMAGLSICGNSEIPMKYAPFALLVLCSLTIVSCSKEKAEIDKQKQSTLNMIEDRKEAVNVQAKDATIQTDINALVDKANIEADRVTDQARLDADKKKAEADAVAAKARVDAERQ